MMHTFIVTVETAFDLTYLKAERAETLRSEIQSNLESLDYSIAAVSVREYTGRPWLLLGGVQE